MQQIYNLLIDKFDDNWLGWEPETLERALLSVSVDPTPKLLEKIMCLQALLLTDAIYNDCFVFEKAVCLFNNYPARFNQFQQISAGDIMSAIEEMEKIRNRDVFSDEVLEYIADVFKEDGIDQFPTSLFKPEEITYMQRYLNGEER